jgi:uncharacterized SAM-binding protein YcdF (DUF218 family)
MLDPSLCNRPISQWLTIKSIVSNWLMTPGLVVFPFIFAIILPSIIPQLPWKHQLRLVGIISLLIYFTASFPLIIAVATKGLVVFLPQDSGMTADAIVVLGRGNKFSNSRVKVTTQLWKSHRAPLIFASGVGDAPQMLELFKEKDIPEQALLEENCSRTTAENALFTAMMLEPQSVKRIILVTDPPHMLRSLLTFRNIGFTVIPHTSPLPSDLAPMKKAMMVFYEYMGLLSYGIQGYFLPHSSHIAEHHQDVSITHS